MSLQGRGPNVKKVLKPPAFGNLQIHFFVSGKNFLQKIFLAKEKVLVKEKQFLAKSPEKKSRNQFKWVALVFGHIPPLSAPTVLWLRAGVLFYFQGILISFCSTESRYDWKCLNRQCESRGVEPQGRSLGLESKVRLGSECDSATLYRGGRGILI